MTKSKRQFIDYLYAFCLFLLVTILILSLSLWFFGVPKYRKLAIKYADENKIDAKLVLAVMKVESNYNSKATSEKGACGLMQLTKPTFEFVTLSYFNGEKLNIYDENDNIKVGCYYLRYLFNKFGNWHVTLAAYNAGEGNVRGWLSNEEYSKNGKTLIKIPFAETENYLKKVEYYFKLYGGKF